MDIHTRGLCRLSVWCRARWMKYYLCIMYVLCMMRTSETRAIHHGEVICLNGVVWWSLGFTGSDSLTPFPLILWMKRGWRVRRVRRSMMVRNLQDDHGLGEMG